MSEEKVDFEVKIEVEKVEKTVSFYRSRGRPRKYFTLEEAEKARKIQSRLAQIRYKKRQQERKKLEKQLIQNNSVLKKELKSINSEVDKIKEFFNKFKSKKTVTFADGTNSVQRYPKL